MFSDGVRKAFAWARLRRRRGQGLARTLTVFALLSTALVVSLGGAYLTVQNGVSSQIIEGGSLSVVEVRSDSPESRPLNSAALSTLAELPGVATVEPEVLGASIYGADGGWVMPVAAYQPSQPPPGAVSELEPGQIIVPASAQGTDFTKFVGTNLSVEYTSRTGKNEGESEALTRQVVGTYDPSWQIYGADAVLMPFEDALELVAAREGVTPKAFMSEYGVESALIRADSTDEVATLVSEIRDAGFTADPLSDRLGKLPGVVTLLPGAALIAALVAVLLVVAGVATAVNGSVRTQLKDLALLRVNGWDTKDVRLLVIAESAWAVTLGALWGCPLGAAASVVMSSWIGNLVGSFDVVSATIVSATAGITVLVLLFGIASLAAYLAARRSLQVDPYIAVRVHES